jgi:hypothetical protein
MDPTPEKPQEQSPEQPPETMQSILAEMERTHTSNPVKPVRPPTEWRSSLWWKVAIGVGVALMFLPLVMFFVPEAPSGPQYEGFLDTEEGTEIMGWAWDGSRPKTPISVVIDDGVHPPVTVVADRPRGDLKVLGKGDGKHGFYFEVPQNLRDGKAYDVQVRFADTQRPLDNTPRKIVYAKDTAEAAKVR